MKKIIIMLLVFLTYSFCYAESISNFSDIDDHWAKEDIKILLRNNSVSGYDDGCFKPNKEITIAEFLKILFSENDTELNKTGKMWPDWYLNTAVDKGYIKIEDKEDWNLPITRIKAVEILSNYLGKENLKNIKQAKNSFSDLSKDKKEVVLKLVNLGIISGYKDNTFREDENVTRAQACKLILKAYDTKVTLQKNKKFDVTPNNTNIDNNYSGDTKFENRYEIKNKRIHLHDAGRYCVSNDLTMNQEYVNDSKVINLIKTLVDDDSYTALIYVPDKYTINALNVCYGRRESYVNNGNYIFQIRFYENGNYNVAEATGIDKFMEDSFAKLRIDRMWDRLSEFDSDSRCSERNLYKLEEAIGVILDKNVKKEVAEYIVEKMKEAKDIPENEFEPKIVEVKKFGKYTLNILCTRGTTIDIYFKKFN